MTTKFCLGSISDGFSATESRERFFSQLQFYRQI